MWKTLSLCKWNVFPRQNLFVYCYLQRLLYFPYSPCFFSWIPGTAWAGSWVLISTVQVSCQTSPNKGVSKMLMEGAYSFEELQFNPWKLAGLEFQLRRSCSSNADLGCCCSWCSLGEEGRDACWRGGRSLASFSEESFTLKLASPNCLLQSNLFKFKVTLQIFLSWHAFCPWGDLVSWLILMHVLCVQSLI